MADTYGDLLDAIAEETRRPRASFGTRISACVQEAIDDCQRHVLYFSDLNNTFTTVASQEYYTSSDAAFIANIIEFDSVVITLSGSSKDDIRRANWADLERLNFDGISTGQPYRYAYRNKSIRLYPIPNDAWTIRVRGAAPLTRLSADADTNSWTTRGEGEKLIRCQASAYFYGRHLRLADRAAQFQAEADKELDRLVNAQGRRQSTGIIRASL